MSPKNTDIRLLIVKKQAKICKECVYYKAEVREATWETFKGKHILCTYHQREKDVDLVSGEVIIKNGNEKKDLYCKTARGLGRISCRLAGICGKEGRFFVYNVENMKEEKE